MLHYTFDTYLPNVTLVFTNMHLEHDQRCTVQLAGSSFVKGFQSIQSLVIGLSCSGIEVGKITSLVRVMY